MRRWLLSGSVLAAFGAGLGYLALLAYRQPGPLAVSADVVVPHGPFEAVAEQLADKGVVGSAWVLRGYEAATVWQGPVRAAEFSFPAHASVQAALAVLRQGRPVQHLLTVAEGLTSARVAELLAGGVGVRGAIAVPPEGGFLPETYAYELGSSAAAILQRGEAAMARALARAWAGRDEGLPLRSRRELLVLASLVERETGLPAERPLVAAVFLNRLRLGMRLQSDPTVIYPASGGAGELPHGLQRDELARESPYNTYAVSGLPGGAICNPGEAAIDAVAHPGRTDALYFVADGSGGHVFARALWEHERNVAKYRAMGR